MEQSQSFRKQLYTQHGPAILSYFRHLDTVSQKLAKTSANLLFLITCRDNDLVPKGLRLKDPCRSHRSYKLLRKTEAALVRQCINDMRHKKHTLVTKKVSLEHTIQQIVSHEDWTRMKKSTDHMENKIFNKCQQRHDRKFQSIHKKEQPCALETKNTVINKSSISLSYHQELALARGLNFAIAPSIQPIPEIITNMECVAQFLPQEQKSEFRFEIRKAIDQVHPPKSNISPAEKRAIFELRNNENIIILPADKGRAAVVLDKEDYHKKIDIILSDPTKFTMLNKNPVPKIEAQCKKLIKEMKIQTKVKIKENCKPPHIYGLPKIHKPETPLRPVVSCIGSTIHPLAKYLVNILNPLQNNITSNINNSKNFVDRTRNISLKPETIMVSFDVVNLFTSVPVEEALIHLRDAMITNNSWHQTTDLNMDQILSLTEFCVKNTFFQFRDSFYKQIDGMAMGSPLSPLLCNIFMARLELKALTTACYRPDLWLRYVDDTFVLWNHETKHLQEFLSHLNGQNPAIQFTMEVENQGSLPFLDVRVERDNNNLKFSVHRKETHTDQYLHSQSNHPFRTKIGIVKGMVDRAKSLCTTQSSLEEELQRIDTSFRKNGYSKNTIKRAKRNNQERPTRSNIEYRHTVTVPYSGSLTEKLRRICHKYRIRLVAKSTDTIKNRLNKVVPKRPKEMHQDVIYSVPLLPCNKMYIGETGRTLGKRLSEHKTNFKYQRAERSKIVEHCLSCPSSCLPHFEDTQIIGREMNAYKRKIRESLEMERLGQRNVGSKTIEIGAIWNKSFINRAWNNSRQTKSISHKRSAWGDSDTKTSDGITPASRDHNNEWRSPGRRSNNKSPHNFNPDEENRKVLETLVV